MIRKLKQNQDKFGTVENWNILEVEPYGDSMQPLMPFPEEGMSLI